MPIRKDPRNGRWFYRFKRNGRGYFAGQFRTYEQAKEAEVKAFDRAIKAEVYPERGGQDMTFTEGGRWFFEEHAKKTKRTWKNDRAQITLMERFFRGKLLRDIKPNDVEAFLDWVQKTRGVNDHTRNHYLAELKAIYNRLKKRQMYFGDNPAWYVEMRKVPKARVRFLYPSEQKLLTPAVAQDALVWPYYVVALHTGMRAGEIAAMRIEDISILRRDIFVPNSKNRRSRHIPMSEELARFLEGRIAGKAPADYALAGVIRDYVSRRFIQICRRLGLSDFRFHDLRHTFAAYLLNKGVPIYKVSKILGHSSVVVTEQHYGHLSLANLKDAVDQIDGVIDVLSCTEVAPSNNRELVQTSKTI
jgi:integrase